MEFETKKRQIDFPLTTPVMNLAGGNLGSISNTELGRNLPDREINQNYRRHGEQITLFSPQIYFISKTEKYENNSGTNVLESYKLVARLSLLNGLDMTPLFYHILRTFLDE